MAVDGIGGIQPLPPAQRATPASGAEGAGRTDGAGDADGAAFSGKLERAVGSVEGLQAGAVEALEELASGEQVDLHGTMVELEKADIALRASTSVRDKLIGAYEQIMNMAL